MTPTERAALRALLEALTGCGANSCCVRKPRGMATNGGCRCLDHISEPPGAEYRFKTRGEQHRWLQSLGRIAKAAPALLDDVERLERRAKAYRELCEAFAEHSGKAEACRLALAAVEEATNG